MLLSYPNLTRGKEITGVIHVGGHIGEEFGEYSKIKNLIVFEPMDFSFEKLKENANKHGLSHAILVNKALGATCGEIEMISDPTGLCASVLEPKEHLNFSPDVIFSIRKKVELSTLDTEISEDHPYNFLNMDCQGYELEVLKGGEKTLEKIQYVYTEVNRGECYEGNALIEEMDSYLGERGFVKEEEKWKGLWGDAFYVRR